MNIEHLSFYNRGFNDGLAKNIEINKLKELTNEEISDIRDKFFAPDGCNIYTFARALLKKAQGND